MSKRFWVLSAAAVALSAPGAALAAPQGHAAPTPPGAALPDFPPDAEPGACYARMRDDGPGPAAAAPGVWTLKRGHGPEAVWSYSEPGPGARAPSWTGGYRWVRVLCEDGRTPFIGDAQAHRGPATGTTGAGLAPPPPPVTAPPPMLEGPPADQVPPPPPPVPPLGAEPRFGHGAPHRPFHHAPPPHGAGPFPVGPFAHPFLPPTGPMGPHFAGPPVPPPAPVSPPRWFGDRFLHWAGKAPPVW